MPAIPENAIGVCGVSEKVLEEARARQAKWVNKRRLKWYIVDRLPGLTLEVLTACYHQAFSNWQEVCGLVFEQTKDGKQADFLIQARKIDRASGVLAEHELPFGTDQPLHGWFDTSESWTVSKTPGNKIDLLAVSTHEFGHGIGLSHLQAPGSLLNPYYVPGLQKPQKADIAEAQARYGKPVEEPKPLPTPTPTPDGKVLISDKLLVSYEGLTTPVLYIRQK
jgi:hypothetical protein